MSDPSESASCGRVDDEIWSAHAGVEVPIPTPMLLPPLGLIEVNEFVEVDHLEFIVSDPEPATSASQRN